jgi:hypothetical protein
MGVDSYPIQIGTILPAPGTGSNEAVQVPARLVDEEPQPASAYVVPTTALHQCLPDTQAAGGRRLCFGIAVVLVLGALVQ